MSSSFWPVLRAMLNTSFGLSALRWRYLRRRQRLWEVPLVIWGMGTLAVMFGYGAYRVLLTVAKVGAALGQPEMALGLATTMAQALVLLLSFFMVVSAFYFARDLRILVPLPVRPGDVITAKFLTVLVGEYVTVLFIYLPAVFAYSRVVPFGPLKWIAALMVFLVLPIPPLAITSLVAIVFMRTINRRQRDILFYVGSFAFLALILTWQFAVARAPTANLDEYLRELISSRLGLLRVVARRFPPAYWATLAVHSWPSLEGAGGMLATVGLGLGSVALIGAAGDRLFYRGLIGGEEVSRGRSLAAGRRRGIAGTEATTLGAPRSPLAALFWREWMLILRTPVWVMNNLAPLFFMPLFMFVVMVAQQGGLRQVLDALAASPNGYTYLGLGIAGYLSFLGGVGGLAATSVSREGARLWISRVAPQPAVRQVLAKLAMAVSAVLASAIPALLVVAAVVRPPLLHMLGGTVAGVAGTIAVTCIGLRMDVARPMLRWQDPREPVKTNLNALMSIGLFLIAVIGGGLIARLMMLYGHHGLAVYASLTGVGALASWVTFRNLWNTAEAGFARLEI